MVTADDHQVAAVHQADEGRQVEMPRITGPGGGGQALVLGVLLRAAQQDHRVPVGLQDSAPAPPRTSPATGGWSSGRRSRCSDRRPPCRRQIEFGRRRRPVQQVGFARELVPADGEDLLGIAQRAGLVHVVEEPGQELVPAAAAIAGVTPPVTGRQMPSSPSVKPQRRSASTSRARAQACRSLSRLMTRSKRRLLQPDQRLGVQRHVDRPPPPAPGPGNRSPRSGRGRGSPDAAAPAAAWCG